MELWNLRTHHYKTINMKKFIILLLCYIPISLLAQKGTIKPVEKQPASSVTVPKQQNDMKTWIVDANYSTCIDSVTLCYIIKEDGETKSVPKTEVFFFDYEEGYIYTILVKPELKAPPITAYTGIYNYIVEKVISKKPATVKPSFPVSETSVLQNQEVETTKENTNTMSVVFSEIESLKTQIKELKKQIETIRLQSEMQLQLFNEIKK